MFGEGMADGQVDADLIANCPPGEPMGPQRPEGYPNNMYHRGYHRVFDNAQPHVCGPQCRWQREERERREREERERREREQKAGKE